MPIMRCIVNCSSLQHLCIQVPTLQHFSIFAFTQLKILSLRSLNWLCTQPDPQSAMIISILRTFPKFNISKQEIDASHVDWINNTYVINTHVGPKVRNFWSEYEPLT